jgi:hypothetical protein
LNPEKSVYTPLEGVQPNQSHVNNFPIKIQSNFFNISLKKSKFIAQRKLHGNKQPKKKILSSPQNNKKRKTVRNFSRIMEIFLLALFKK